MEYRIAVEPGVKIYVNDINPSGTKTILFLHGWPANHKMFEYQFNYLIAKNYRCIGVDMRGFGKSGKPVYGYDYNRLADDLYYVIEKLNLYNFTLAGHSTGGAVAIRYMARYRGYRVSKLALFAAAAPSLIQRPNFPYGLQETDVAKIIKETYRDRPQMLQNFGENFFFLKVSEPFARWFLQLGLEAASWSTIAVANSWLKEELFRDLEQIHVPTLILHGRHDKIVLYPLAVIQHERIKNSRLITFEHSGHGLFYDEMMKFNEILARFAD